MMYPSVKPKQSLGQNFLTDSNVAANIVKAFSLKENDRVVEIGPGLGVLTASIQPQVQKLYAIEIDQRFIEQLEQDFKSADNLEIINQDFLKFDLNSIADPENKIRLVGNIPYHITSPIFFKVLEHRHLVKDLTLLTQTQVAERMVAKTSTKAYGILSVMAQTFAEVKLLMHVPHTVFTPQPKVESSLVHWEFTNKREQDIKDFEQFRKLVRTAFNQRRKMLRNSLKGHFSLDRAEKFKTLRPEQLVVDDWIRLFNLVTE